jgi:RNA polymerase sigma-70 factor (ECF subfamily)
MSETLAWDLGRFRPLLLLQARQLCLSLDPRLRPRFDASDVVHDALLRAHASQGGFRGKTEAERIAWLRRILTNALRDKIDYERAQQRHPGLERPIEEMVTESSVCVDAFLADQVQELPSQAVQREELWTRMAAAIEELSEDQRNVVILRKMMGLRVEQIARQLGRTQKAVAGLVARGLHRLRELLADLQGVAP